VGTSTADYVMWRDVMAPDNVVVIRDVRDGGNVAIGLIDKVGRRTVGMRLLSHWTITGREVDLSISHTTGLYMVPAEVKKVISHGDYGYVTIVPLTQAARIDKRKAQRYRVALPVVFTPVSGDKLYEGIIEDISWAGCRLIWFDPEDVHLNKIRIKVKIASGIEEILGKVVWRQRGESGDVLGVEFLEPPAKLFKVFFDILGEGE